LVDKIDEVRATALLAYTIDFQRAFDAIGASALSPVGTPLVAAAALYSIYLPKEIVAATSAAQASGMTPEEGVAALASFVEFTVEYERARTFWGRLLFWVRLIWTPMPQQGTGDYYRRLMSNYVSETWLGIDPIIRKQFKNRYLDAVMLASNR
jgi:hypothetical protein